MMHAFEEIIARADAFALFFDIDGTLVDMAARPDDVVVSDALCRDLVRARLRYDGALALLSGRSLAWIDTRFGDAVAAVGALHGLERRSAGGVCQRFPAPPTLAAARQAICTAFAAVPGIIIEDKGLSIAVHYRAAPEAFEAVRSLAEDLARESGGTLAALPGKCVVELRTTGAHKGSALDAFMLEEPFLGRRPVFFGDDRTDEDAFAAARALNGIAVAVGREPEAVGADLYLDDPPAVRAFLADAAAGGRQGGRA
ncbi:trehalose-phosphatase [Chelatococcus daeguensis]|uniref:Trehalose 6-phosphate phosphatase n=1 Tax=Chelatococcus daeguensis TaxID=444444 RepID=A0AAC9JN59_9HYPH|nr:MULTISPECIES: trehalose-phosphatase [Chelatococcus]APF35941.1 trehalose-phosphatase [Chelatococcus daeguensis]KZE28168.1 hypothetical protein AVW15_08640 [Chelatococcus daeguensis]MBM3084485.1 trehalose-phosphatase [Chelatococcus daeguensis]